MKALTTAGLTKLIQLIKSSFISNTDTVTTNTVTLADVATTGSYNDLSNKPTIPTVGNGIITIKQGGTQKGWFTTNQSGNTTINLDAGGGGLSIPTAISDLTDDTSTTPIDKAESVEDQRDSSSLKYWTGTKAQYDAIVTKDSDTIYNVEDTTSPIVDILNTLYPIGAIYIGTMATCPLSVLGVGTWQLVAQDRVLQGAGTRGAVGSEIDESLPNIKGALTNNYQMNIGAVTASGAFVTTTGSTAKYSNEGTGTATRLNGYDFDASRTSSTYQDNAPVQQDGYLVNIWERTA